jgi:DMSO/TMAO reductase YedYZ molybdopterin-dependent catalytic subunit
VGIAAGAVAIAVSWAFSAVVPDAPFPPLAAAQALLRAMPGDVATFFIEALGHWARDLLALGAVVCSLALAAGLLRWTRAESTRPVRAAGASAFLAVVMVALGPGRWTPAAVLIGTALSATSYVLVVKRLTRTLAAGGVDRPGRRHALRYGFGMAAAIALGGGAFGWIASRLGGPDTSVDLVAPAERLPAPSRAGFPDIPGLSNEITSVSDHYEVDINLVPPIVQAGDWKLKVHGLVQQPLELGFAQLQRDFEVVEEYATLSCISNEVGGDLVGHSLWGGVRLADVLDAAGVSDAAVDVVFRAADGYSDSIPIEVAKDPQTLVAVSQNREPLTQRHGFPCRIRVPKIFGMKNVKWLTEIELVDHDFQGYWMERGWSDGAEVRTSSRIDVPKNGEPLRAGNAVWVAGVAWAGDRGIKSVDVSTDGGTRWEPAQLKEPAGPYSWTLWAHRWTPSRTGNALLICRATDGAGQVQEAGERPPHPSGSTGLHRVQVQVT